MKKYTLLSVLLIFLSVIDIPVLLRYMRANPAYLPAGKHKEEQLKK